MMGFCRLSIYRCCWQPWNEDFRAGAQRRRAKEKRKQSAVGKIKKLKDNVTEEIKNRWKQVLWFRDLLGLTLSDHDIVSGTLKIFIPQ